ncbi:D-lactaldehyde dehydrogenase [Neolentinus lepideus HHB14362 ss-1]|uniref:D-lactaldehyde dehydrogenase n=1 Tax=Neolentinus lepideus HHB14362 ss-1 TaxID=1314782 RepID=A0A165SQC4_9AGAM|nr:D-lactaldehyde dehydrogenase [Neolentinus lepideus HHB14362 ss-1]
MPAVAAPAKVLVTGANGYIAIWVVRRLLEAGYTVRGTVRSPAKGEHLKKSFESYGNKLELHIVEDITKEGAFDDAVKGVDAIEHTASPFHFKASHPDELLGPAVKGTVGVLQSALKFGTDVKRVVVTSSCAAVLQVVGDPKVFSKSNWNEQSIKAVEEKGKDAHPGDWYRASKTLAEKAAWDFVAKNKASIQWDLVVLNPPYVFGPVIHEISSPDQLNTSMDEIYSTLLKHSKDDQTLASLGNAWIDVRDLARAHVLAIQREQAGGNRFIVCAGSYKWQDFGASALPKGIPGASKAPGVAHMFQYDVSRARDVLGVDQYITLEECTKDSLEDFKERGW